MTPAVPASIDDATDKFGDELDVKLIKAKEEWMTEEPPAKVHSATATTNMRTCDSARLRKRGRLTEVSSSRRYWSFLESPALILGAAWSN
jgi:hypothetical protein